MNARPAPAPDTSSKLLAGVRGKDADAWLRLVEWISPFILRWCRRAGLQPSDCEDVSQDVLQRVWTSFATFRKDDPTDSFRGWVYTITRNRCRDFLETRRPATTLASDVALPSQPDPDEALDLQRRAVWLLVREVVAAHGEEVGFRAFYRTAVDGLNATEASKELGLTPWAVRQQKCRWVKRLRERLAVDFDGLLG